MMYDDPASPRIMVVEDEFYIADELRTAFAASGIDVLGPVPTADEARELLGSTGQPDAVLLDVNLRGRTAYDLADTLRADGVPFAFVTGYDPEVLPDRFAGNPAIRKPVTAGQLDGLVRGLLGTATPR